MGTTHLASWQKDREDWLGGRFSFAGSKSRRNDARCVVTEGQGRLVGDRFSFACGKSRRNDARCVVAEGQGRLVGAGFHLLVAKELRTKKTSNKSLFLNRKTLHLHNVRCGGVPLGQLLREAEASAVANRAPISLGRHKKQVCFLLLSAFITFETQLKLLWK